jgi:hypothetical protein
MRFRTFAIVAVAILGIAAAVVGYRATRSPPELKPSAIVATRLAGEDAPGVVVAHRSETGTVTELELLRARDGRAVWRTPAPSIRPEDQALAVADGVVAMAGQNPARGTTLHAFGAADGQKRWSAEIAESTDRLSIERGTLLVQTSKGIAAFELATGKPRWDVAGVTSHYAPISVGGFLVAPTEHATLPALRLVELASGRVTDIGRGLRWPGVALGDRYYTVHRPGRGGEALVSAALLAGETPPDAGARPAVAIAGVSGSRPILVELVLATGEIRPVRIGAAVVSLPEGCEEGTFFTIFEDKVLCDHDKGGALFSRSLKSAETTSELRAEAGFRFWGGGASQREWVDRDRWAFLAARTRFVPMVQNEQGTDDARVCVLDLEETRLVWCSARKIADSAIHIYGWLHIESRDDVHLIHLPLRPLPFTGGAGPVIVLDGKTGKVRGAIDLRAPTLPGFPSLLGRPAPRSGDVLLTERAGFLFGLDLTRLTLSFQRGPAPIAVSSALAEAESILGPLPR